MPRELSGYTTLEMQFVAYWIRKEEERETERWWHLMGKMLGTIWNKKDFEVTKVDPAIIPKAKEEVFYPLSMLLAQSDFIKTIKSELLNTNGIVGSGEYRPEKNERMTELGTLTKDDFLKFMAERGTGIEQATNKK